MPNCYSLAPKADSGAPDLRGNKQFIAIDEHMCEHFGVTPHEERWYLDWENRVGLSLAVGRTWDDLRNDQRVDDEDFLDVLDYLEGHYEVECWAQR